MIRHNYTRKPLVLLLVLIAALTTGCASLSTVPGISLVVDSLDAGRLAAAFEDGSVNDDDMAETMRRPMPPPPGLSFEVASVRRMVAALALNDYPMLTSTYEGVVKHGRPGTFKSMGTMVMAVGETFRGNSSAALRLFDQWEAEVRVTQRQAATPRSDAGTYASTIALYMDTALAAGRLDVAERLMREHFEGVLQSKALPEFHRAQLHARSVQYRASVAEQKGDVLEARRLAVIALEEQRRVVARSPSASEREKTEAERGIVARLASVSRAALMINEFALSRSSIQEAKERVAKSGNPNVLLASVRSAEADHLAALGRFEEAARASSEAAQSMPAFVRRSQFMQAALKSGQAVYLLSAGKFDEARRLLSTVDRLTLSDSDVRRTLQLTTVSANALGGQADQSLDELDAMAAAIANRQTSLLALGHFGVTAIAYQRRGSATGRTADFVKAVDGGRRFARAYRLSRASGAGRNAAFHEPMLRNMKESYLIAASESIGRNGVTFDDLLDAVALMQESETDDDIASAVSRQRSIPGLNAAQLREL